MSFYSDFSAYYDQIFPTDDQTIKSFIELFKPQGRILDIGCGAGGYAFEMAKKGFKVDAIDFDEGMIQIAQQKQINLHIKVDFKQGNMLDLDLIDTYDGIYCIGNTLVHLPNEMDIFEALGRIYDALKPDGTFIFQIVNYDRIIDQNVNSLPTLKAQNVEFVRDYELSKGKILFNTTLKTTDSIYNNTVELLPMRQSDLFKMMTQIGFHEVRSYGRFDQSPFESQLSFMLVMKGTK